MGLPRSEEHTSELQSRSDLVCRLLLEKKKRKPRPWPRFRCCAVIRQTVCGCTTAVHTSSLEEALPFSADVHSSIFYFFFFLIIRPPPKSPLFPYTALFRSRAGRRRRRRAAARSRGVPGRPAAGGGQIGRGHVRTPGTIRSCMPSSG